jgi:hypothetical protein
VRKIAVNEITAQHDAMILAAQSAAKQRYSREIEDAIALARFSRSRATVTATDGTEAYAYPKPEGRIAWGVNAPQTGVNVLRGIRRPDGSDEAVT